MGFKVSKRKLTSSTDNEKHTKPKEVTFGSKDTRNISKFDKIDVMILAELLKNSDIKSRYDENIINLRFRFAEPKGLSGSLGF